MKIAIKKRFDVGSGGWILKASPIIGRKSVTARLWYSVKADQYVITGDFNGLFPTVRKATEAFSVFAEDPHNCDAGRPPTAAEVTMPIPAGMDPGTLLEAPRVKGRRDRKKALDWWKQHGGTA